MATIIAKHTVGSKTTHNRDGRFTRAWRLWSDGRVERTNSSSKYQRYIDSETVPAEIVTAATEAGVTIQAGRPDWRKLPRKSAAATKSESLSIRVTVDEAAIIKAAAAAAGMTLTEWIGKVLLLS